MKLRNITAAFLAATFLFPSVSVLYPSTVFAAETVSEVNTDIPPAADTVRFTVVDFDTGEKIALDKEFSYFAIVPYIWSSDDTQQSPSTNYLYPDSNPYIWEQTISENETMSVSLADGSLNDKFFLPKNYEEITRYENGSVDVVIKLKSNAGFELPPGSVRITVTDGDTGELVPDEVLAEEPLIVGTNIVTKGGVTGPIIRADKNRTVIKSNLASLYKSADKFELLFDGKSEITIYDNNSMDLSLTTAPKAEPNGDVNGDETFGISDAVTLQQWLLGSAKVNMKNWRAADYNKDNQLDIFDLVLMKKELLRSIDLPVEVSIQEGGGVVGANIIYKVYSEGEKYFLSYQDLTYDQKPKSIVKQISEQEYREIMAQDYDSMIRFMEDPDRPGWSEIVFVLELSYSDGSQKKAVSDRMPSVLTELRDMLAKSSDYVEPDNRIEYGATYNVLGDGVKLYSGPDESYEVIDNVPSWTKLKELGYQNGNDPWIFTEYSGQYGWVNSSGADISVYLGAQWGKPVIYIYPEKETDVHVELELTTSDLYTTYPRYNNGWDVTAYPDGSLLNKADGTHHKYLFWESVNARTRFDFSKGFCVAGSDTECFLKEKLTYMGLTEEEMNEFIVYWLPKMEHNKYNLIAFQGDVYTNSAKLSITPTPDSLLRIFMAYVPLEEAVDIQPQQLETFERNGFTVVEWGGSEINS
jgi:hypothetical protein